MDSRIHIQQRPVRDSVRRIPEHVSEVVEHFFYSIGFSIAKQPYKWILFCMLPVIVCLAGFTRFRIEKNPLNLWVPPEADFVHDTKWLMKNFGEGQRLQKVLLTANNVLEPKVLLKLNEITKSIMTVRSTEKYKLSWNDVCFKIPIIKDLKFSSSRKKRDTAFDDVFFDEEPAVKINESNLDPIVIASPKQYCRIFNSFHKDCLLFSILDLWEYNSTIIEKLSLSDVIDKINTVTKSPTTGHSIDFRNFLGGVLRNESGHIVSAKAVESSWIVHINFSQVDMDTFGNNAGTADWATDDVLEWESVFVREMERFSRDLEKNNEGIFVMFEAGRSFGDVSETTMFEDVDKMMLGSFIMGIYVLVILSNYNFVELRFYLMLFVLTCIASAFIIAVGTCSLIGIPYGPVHTSLPFLLMGLGVDDAFIMMASWQQVRSIEKNRMKSLEENVGLMLSHAGAAICITSLTDVVAFIIGASTILPTLQSYCIYAAVGVLVTFLLQITFFVAVFTLDAKRIQNKKNFLVPCIVHEKFNQVYVAKKHSNTWKIFDNIYSKVILTTPAKFCIILLTIILAGFGAYGSYYLEQWFDPVWFLPKDTYLSKYLMANKEQFPSRGYSANIFIGGNVNYSTEFSKILFLADELEKKPIVQSLQAWPRKFVDFMKTNYGKDIIQNPLDSYKFRHYLSKFLFSQSGGRYQANFHFETNLTCGQNLPVIRISSIDFTFVRLNGPTEWIPAMDNTRKLVSKAQIDGYVFVWSKMFGTWETDKVIAQEVMRNLLLALVCVMSTTAFLIAELQTCFWIFLCVLLSLLDVCGFMYFWGFTIDIVTCISLELAIGLCVDYAAHVAHAFLITPSREGEKKDRIHRTLTAVRHIGAAVLYGAGSTLIALFFLLFSRAYVFHIFFKIFFLVILFGLWHGLIFLPVILSTFGPKSLQIHKPSHSRELKSLSQNVSNSTE